MSEVIVDGIRYIPARKIGKMPVVFSKLISDARAAKGESLEFAANNIGTSKAHLWTLEQGEAMPRLDMLQSILRYYGIDYDEIQLIERERAK